LAQAILSEAGACLRHPSWVPQAMPMPAAQDVKAAAAVHQQAWQRASGSGMAPWSPRLKKEQYMSIGDCDKEPYKAMCRIAEASKKEVSCSRAHDQRMEMALSTGANRGLSASMPSLPSVSSASQRMSIERIPRKRVLYGSCTGMVNPTSPTADSISLCRPDTRVSGRRPDASAPPATPLLITTTTSVWRPTTPPTGGPAAGVFWGGSLFGLGLGKYGFTPGMRPDQFGDAPAVMN